MKNNRKHLLNYSILIPYLILSVLGLIVVYSTTSATLIQSGANPFRSVILQGLFWIVSLFLMVLLYNIKLSILKHDQVIRLVIIVEFVLLIISRLFSQAINGSHGWIHVGPITLQPAEYLKFIIIWYLASVFSKRQQDIGIYDYQALTEGRTIPATLTDWRLVTLILLFMVGIQPDLGNATIIFLTAIIMYSVSGIAYRWFSAIMTGIVAISAFILLAIRLIGVDIVAKIPIFGYIAKRFRAYYNPFKDLSDSGHQLANSYYAMVNGGWFGRGLGNSIEKKGYLPEAQTDFVFSIVVEELGLIGAIIILGLVLFLILRILIVGIKAQNAFNAMVAIGVGGMLLMQVFVNIGGISGLIPSTGVTFPFLSQGGNSLLVLSIAIAIVLNIDSNERRDRQVSISVKD